MTIDRMLKLAVFLAAITMGCAGPAMAQVCTMRAGRDLR